MDSQTMPRHRRVRWEAAKGSDRGLWCDRFHRHPDLRELRRRGAEFLIAGRDQASSPLSQRVRWGPRDGRFAQRSRRPALAAGAVRGCVACAGPSASRRAGPRRRGGGGTHYLDTTGEQPSSGWSLSATANRLRKRRRLVSAMGFDLHQATCRGPTAEQMGPLEEIVIAYCVSGFTPTQGTALSALEIMRGADFVWQGGLRPAPRSASGGRWRFPEPIGEQRMLRYPAGEQITVPRHVQTESVRTLLRGMVIPTPLMPLALASTPALHWRCAHLCEARRRR